MFFDTHAHYDDHQFDGDRETLLSAMKGGGVDNIVNAGTTVDSSEFSVALAEKYDFIYAAAGIHPNEMASYSSENISRIKKLLEHKKCVAVGEIGLDYHYGTDDKDMQQQALRDQLDIARQMKKPVIIHERDACRDTLDIVFDYPDLDIVFHCYSGSWETAKTILDRGWYLSFNGVVTFKNAKKPVEVVEKMPLDRLMLETDCPYLAPVPLRGSRNSSLNMHYTAEKIALLRGISVSEIGKITTENAFKFFKITAK
jgi:TatD DNase family protein